MKYVIEGLEVFPGKTCVFAAVENIMTHHKYNISEADMFFTGDALNSFEYNMDLNYISPRTVRYLPAIGKNTSILIDMVETNGNKDFLEEMCSLISRGYILLLIIDTSKLSYHRVYRENDGRAHSILLYGIDTDESIAYIGDTHIREYTGQITAFKTTTPLREIIDGTFMYTWFDFQKSRALRNDEIIGLAAESMERFLNEEKMSEKQYHGYSALKKYIQDLETLMDMDGDTFTAKCINVNYNFRVRFCMYINDYITAFFKEHSELQAENCNLLYEKIKGLNFEWNKIALSLLKLGKMKKKDKIPEIIDMCKKMMFEQDLLFRNVLNLIRELKYIRKDDGYGEHIQKTFSNEDSLYFNCI